MTLVWARPQPVSTTRRPLSARLVLKQPASQFVVRLGWLAPTRPLLLGSHPWLFTISIPHTRHRGKIARRRARSLAPAPLKALKVHFSGMSGSMIHLYCHGELCQLLFPFPFPFPLSLNSTYPCYTCTDARCSVYS